MFEFINKLRQKPERTKKQIAFLVAFAFAGFIFVIWFSVVYPDFKQTQENQDKVSNLEPSPISTFVASVADGFVAIGEQFSKIKETMNLFSSDPAHYSATSTATSTSQ